MKKTSVAISCPSQIAKYINNIEDFEFEGESIHDFFSSLDQKYDSFSSRLLDDGMVKRFINIYIDKKNINTLDGVNTKIPSGSKISILLSRAGG